MGRKNSSIHDRELIQLIAQYEEFKSENKTLYLDAYQIVDIADKYAYEGRFKEAQEIINYGLHLHSGSTSLLIEQAYLYLDNHKMEQAKITADSITDEFSSEVKLLKAEICLAEGALDTAREILNTIDDSNELENIIDIVYLYLDMGYPEIAKEWLDKGSAQYSEDEDFIGLTADYQATTSQFEAASTNYDRLIDIEPYNPTYWVGLAKCRFALEDWEKAIEACDFALAADDKFGEAYAYRGHCYFYLNNSDAAIENYKKAIEYKSILPEMGYMFLGMGYSNKEQWQEAYDCFQKVLELFEEKGDGDSPLLVDTYVNEITAACQLGYYKEAHILCDKAKSIFTDKSTIYLAEGNIFLAEKVKKKADKCFKQALKLDSSIDIWYQIASAYSEADLLYDAKMHFEKAYELDHHFADVAEKLSVISLMYSEIDDFFKYNKECAQPISAEMITKLLSHYENEEDGKNLLQEVLARMKKEN